MTVSLVASCASVVDGTGYPSGAAPTGGTKSFPTSAPALASFIKQGFSSVTSAHLELQERLSGASIRASGDETIEGGKTKDLSLTESIPQFGTIKVIIVGSETFVQLPPSKRSPGAKPWSTVTASSSNPVLKALYQSLSMSRQIGSLDSTTLFVQAAGNLHLKDTEQLGGATVGHYSLVVQIDKLPDSFPQKSTLEQTGLHSIPVQLWVDTDGRVRKLSEQISVAGQHVNTDVTLGNFDASVHISAPPPSQVGSD